MPGTLELILMPQLGGVPLSEGASLNFPAAIFINPFDLALQQ